MNETRTENLGPATVMEQLPPLLADPLPEKGIALKPPNGVRQRICASHLA
jgi:hypothetical protein